MKISKFQAGSLQTANNKHYNHQYFSPNSINHTFEIDDNALQIQLEKSTRLIGELNAMARLVPNIDLFITSFVGNEATLSSKIEGTQTELDDVFKAESDINPAQKDDWIEVKLYMKAMENAITKLAELPISTRLIKDTHRILLSSGRGESKMPGEFRTSQNWIGGTSIQNADFVPPHQGLVHSLMSDLEEFLNNQTMVPDMVKIAIIHYQFETIHPFLDGNGRMGRALIPLYFVSKNLLSKPLLYMSAFFEANKSLYYQKLTQVRMDNDLSGWLVFFLKGIEQTAKYSIEILLEILQLEEKTINKIRKKTGSRSNNNLKTLKVLFQKPFIRIEDVKMALSVSATTAKNIVDDLVRIDTLKEVTGNKRNRLFAFSPYLNLLNKDFPTE